MRFRYRNTFKRAARWPETIVKHGQEGWIRFILLAKGDKEEEEEEEGAGEGEEGGKKEVIHRAVSFRDKAKNPTASIPFSFAFLFAPSVSSIFPIGPSLLSLSLSLSAIKSYRGGVNHSLRSNLSFD